MKLKLKKKIYKRVLQSILDNADALGLTGKQKSQIGTIIWKVENT